MDLTVKGAIMKTATLLKEKNGTGIGKVFKLSEPLEGNDYVWVSAVVAAFSGPETFIFGCDQNGEVTSWSELDGSYRGGLDIEKALTNAGYTID